MGKFRTAAVILVLFLVFFDRTAFAERPDMPSDCTYILMDLKTGQVIAEQDADKKVRPASTTKIMTAILALENGRLDQVMDVSKSAVYDIGDGGSNIGINPEESGLTLENLLNAMMVKSANETANIIAENICNTRSEFIDLMNQKAAELGAVNTHFVNPCGKDNAEDAGHLSTARDMVTMARYAMNIPKFREIVSKEYYRDMPSTDMHQVWDPLRSTNKLLWLENLYTYELGGIEYTYTVNGVKTGYTSVARNNLVVSAVNDEGLELIAAIMHASGSSAVFSSAKELLRYGFEHYSLQKLTEANTLVKNVTVENAKDNETLDIVTASDFCCGLPVDEGRENVQIKETINTTVKAPVKAGDILGSAEYSRNGLIFGKVDLIAARNIDAVPVKIVPEVAEKEASGISALKIFLIIIPAYAFLILLRFILRKVSRKVRKRYFFYRR